MTVGGTYSNALFNSWDSGKGTVYHSPGDIYRGDRLASDLKNEVVAMRKEMTSLREAYEKPRHTRATLGARAGEGLYLALEEEAYHASRRRA